MVLANAGLTVVWIVLAVDIGQRFQPMAGTD
jgi:hypothetical protein